MTKEQMSDFCREYGVEIIGYKNKDGYIIKSINGEKFRRNEQRRAHIALIHTFLAIINGIHANDAAEQLDRMYPHQEDEEEVMGVGDFF